MLANIAIWIFMAVAAFWYFGGFRYLARRKAGGALQAAMDAASQSAGVTRLRGALGGGDANALHTALSGASWEDLLAVEPEADAHLPALESYAQAHPDELNGLFLLGSAQVNAAWKARSSATADKVTANQAANFFALLNKADQTLSHALSQHAGCEFLYPPMITAKKGLNQKDEAYAIYQQATQHKAQSFAAAQAMVSLLAERWLGSQDEMFRFAREQKQQNGALPAMGAIELSAHIEQDMEGEEKNYLKKKEVGEALAAAQESVRAANASDAGSRFMRFAALNNIAMVCTHRGDKKNAKQAFSELGANWHAYPWKYKHQDPKTGFIEFAKLVG